jgi:hypothetical protein
MIAKYLLPQSWELGGKEKLFAPDFTCSNENDPPLLVYNKVKQDIKPECRVHFTTRTHFSFTLSSDRRKCFAFEFKVLKIRHLPFICFKEFCSG